MVKPPEHSTGSTFIASEITAGPPGWRNLLSAARPLLLQRFAFIAVPIAFGVWSLLLGKDANWDLRNYHWYNPYLLLDWRFNRDLAPAGLQSYQSSLFDVPWFLLGRYFPAPVVGFVIGAVQSANFFLLYALSRRLLPGKFFPLLVAIVGIAAPISRNQIGTTFNDLIVTIGILGTLQLTVLALDSRKPRSLQAALCAGLVLGFTAAGKLTTGPYAVAALLSLAILSNPWRERLSLAMAMCGGALISGALFFGPWCWWLYHLYGSPTFPFFNSIFHSPWTTLPDQFNFVERPPHGLIEWLTFPWRFTRNPLLIAGVYAFDYRMLAGYVLIPAVLIARRALHMPPLSQAARYLICFTALSYLIWAAFYYVDRSAIAIAMLAPLLIVAVTIDFRIWPTKLALTALLVSLVVAGGGSYERVSWSRNFISADIPEIKDPAHTLIVFGNKPLGFLAPLLPEQVTILELENDIASLTDANSPWTRKVKATISEPWSEMIGFVDSPDGGHVAAAIGSYSAVGLTADLPTCRQLHTTFDPAGANVVMCHLLRSTDGRAQWPGG